MRDQLPNALVGSCADRQAAAIHVHNLHRPSSSVEVIHGQIASPESPCARLVSALRAALRKRTAGHGGCASPAPRRIAGGRPDRQPQRIMSMSCTAKVGGRTSAQARIKSLAQAHRSSASMQPLYGICLSKGPRWVESAWPHHSVMLHSPPLCGYVKALALQVCSQALTVSGVCCLTFIGRSTPEEEM